MATFTTFDRLPEDEEEDFPIPGPLIVSMMFQVSSHSPCALTEDVKPSLGGSMDLPAVVYGAGAFSNQYNPDDHLSGALPLRSIRLALR